MTEKEREIKKYLKWKYNATGVKFEPDGSVTCWADPMPNTNKQGRIFAGWVEELIATARQEKL